MILWQAYLNLIQTQYELLKGELHEPDHVEIGPILEAKDRKFPASAPFGMDWAVIYSDGKYFRVKESYNRCSLPSIGAGRRAHFSFHYGGACPRRDSEGFPLTQEPDTPHADLRIDLDYRGPHIHVGTPEHIPQDRVKGYTIQDAAVEMFLRAVAKHRKTGESLTDLLGIKVIP